MYSAVFDDLENASGKWLKDSEKLEILLDFLDHHADTIITPEMFRNHLQEVTDEEKRFLRGDSWIGSRCTSRDKYNSERRVMEKRTPPTELDAGTDYLPDIGQWPMAAEAACDVPCPPAFPSPPIHRPTGGGPRRSLPNGRDKEAA